MSKSTVAGIVLAVLVVGILIGSYVVPGILASKVRQQAAQGAIAPAIQQAAHQAAEDEAHKIAADLSVKQSANDADRKPPAPKPRDSGAPIQISESAPLEVDREAFSITLPPGSSVDAADADLGSERLVHVRIPGSATVTLVLIDVKGHAQDQGEIALREIREKVASSKDIPPQVLGLEYWAGAISTMVRDKPYIFEVGHRDGRDKACLVILEYPMEPVDNRKEVVARLTKTMETLHMKL